MIIRYVPVLIAVHGAKYVSLLRVMKYINGLFPTKQTLPCASLMYIGKRGHGDLRKCGTYVTGQLQLLVSLLATGVTELWEQLVLGDSSIKSARMCTTAANILCCMPP